MKILHTADIHLREYGDDRWNTLRKLIELGKQENIEIFVISGDLFDRNIDAEGLRPDMREIFSGAGFKIVLALGNHDSDSYKSGMYFGEDAVILTDLHEPFEYKDLMIWVLPFEPIEGEKILSKLRLLASNLSKDKKNILLYHGELLDAFFSRKDFGDEGKGRYMPVRLSYFKELDVDYVLAGHFHSKFDTWKLENENGGYFVYPGSPISITEREIGQRKVNIFEVGGPPREYLLNTPHFQEISIEFDPFTEGNPIEEVRKGLETVHPQASIILTIWGYIDGDKIGTTESELAKQIKGIIKDKAIESIHLGFSDMRVILADDLFKSFMEKLELGYYDEEKRKQMRDVAIKAMLAAKIKART
jgi:DNA repair exonuclease SbcCD nuclease subunit